MPDGTLEEAVISAEDAAALSGTAPTATQRRRWQMRTSIACFVESARIRRIEVKGRKRGATTRLTTNEWYKAVQLGDAQWQISLKSPVEQPSPFMSRKKQASTKANSSEVLEP